MADTVRIGENIALEKGVRVRTRYVGQALHILLERRVEGPVPGTTDADYLEHVPQAELVIEAGTRAVLGKHGLRIEELDHG